MEQLVVDQSILVELVVGDDRPDKHSVWYRVLRGETVVASVSKRRAAASDFGGFKRDHTLYETAVQVGDGPAWRIRPCVGQSPPNRSVFGRSEIIGVSLGKRRLPASQRVVELLDPLGAPQARIATPGGAKTGLLEVGDESFELSPCERAKRGELGEVLTILQEGKGEVLTILQEGKAMEGRSWELRPNSPMTKTVTLPVALLYWHVLSLEYIESSASGA